MTTNVLRTNAEISNAALRILSNVLRFTKLVAQQNNYSDKFGQKGNKIGATYNLRLPVQYKQTSGSAFQAQAVRENIVPIVLNNWVTRDVQMSTEDMTLSMDMFEQRVMKPAAVSAANQIEQYNLDQAVKAIYNSVGTPGTMPSTQATFNTLVTDAQNLIFNNLAQDEFYSLMTTAPFSSKAQVLNVNVFNPGSRIGDDNIAGHIVNGTMGFDWYRSQLTPTHTNGTFSGTPAVNGADQSGNVLNTDGWGAGSTLNVGDIFTIAGVNRVNPQTKADTGELQQFVVTAKNAPGTTHALSISPAIVGPEDPQYQNVSALPADGALLTILGTSGQTYSTQIGWDSDAFGVAFADFEMPKAGMGVVSTKSADTDLGISLQYTAGYDIRGFQELHRIDLLQGFVAQYPQLATRVAV